jgi:magnesium-transporting ATPase (P-type)
MITGDHPATARAIAERLGILDDGGRVVSGVELAALSDAEFAAQVKAMSASTPASTRSRRSASCARCRRPASSPP